MYTEAETFLRDALAMRRLFSKANNLDLASSLNSLGLLLQYQVPSRRVLRAVLSVTPWPCAKVSMARPTTSELAISLNNLAGLVAPNQGEVRASREVPARCPGHAPTPVPTRLTIPTWPRPA